MEQPVAPRRQASMRSLQRRVSGREVSNDNDATDDPAMDVGSDAQQHPNAAVSTAIQANIAGLVGVPPINRSVRTRDHDRITLVVPRSVNKDIEAGGGGGGSSTTNAEQQRGWRSPHGEPYRPLGNPELNFKFSPRLQNDSNLAASSRRHGPGIAASSNSSSFGSKDTTGGQREPSHAASVPRGRLQASFVRNMFPRDLHRRPSEDRQVKLAMRLQESIAQYSPDKMKGLQRTSHLTITHVGGSPRDKRALGDDGDEAGDDDEAVHAVLRRLQQQHYDSQQLQQTPPPPGDPHLQPPSPRHHVQHGDTSFSMLRDAIQQCSTRLRLVRNGQSILETVPPGNEPLDLGALRREYETSREKFLLLQDAQHNYNVNVPPRLLSAKPGGDSDDEDNDPDHGQIMAAGRRSAASRGAKSSKTADKKDEDEDALLYLPYTTRQPQLSPHKPLPTFAEFKASARVNRMPVRTLLSSRASMAIGAATPPPQRKPSSSTRQSRIASTLLAGTNSTPFSSSDDHRQQPLGAAMASSTRQTLLLQGPAAMSEETSFFSTSSPCEPVAPRVHSVVRLQSTVDAMDQIKATQAHTLATTLALLDTDRLDCVDVKFRNFEIHAHLDSDISHMRATAEQKRLARVARNLAAHSTWYNDLLHQILMAHRECSSSSSSSGASSSSSNSSSSSAPLHPAELFCIEVIRRTASEGHVFQKEQLFHLVTMLHREDVPLLHVQQILTYLRRVLQVDQTEWETFFRVQNLQEPVEIFKPNDPKQKDKKKTKRIDKLRAAVTINTVLRRMTSPK